MIALVAASVAAEPEPPPAEPVPAEPAPAPAEPAPAEPAPEPASATWQIAETRELPLGRAFAGTAEWDAVPAVFTGGADGLRVLAPDGRTLAVTDLLHPQVLLVAQLDGRGESEIVACGPEGMALVRGSREGLQLPRPLSDAPCTDLVAFSFERYPGLASLTDGKLVVWRPTGIGLEPDRSDLDGLALASADSLVALLRNDGAAMLLDPDGGVGAEVEAGPFVAIDGDASGFVLEPVPKLGEEPVTGVVGGKAAAWRLDREGHRIRPPGGDWLGIPIAPARAEVVELAGDACPDLLVGDDAGAGLLLVGDCPDGPMVPPEPVVVVEGPPEPLDDLVIPPGELPAPPRVLMVGVGEWPVVNAVVGQPLRFRLDSPGGGAAREWRKRGGPPGFRVTLDGEFSFQPLPEDTGRWRVATRSSGGGRRWAGFELHVWPRQVVLGEPLPPGTPSGADPEPDPPFGGRPSWEGLQTVASFGVAGGFALANGAAWESLGQSRAGATASPYAQLGLSWRVGAFRGWTAVETAPLFRYPSAPDPRSHTFAQTLGVGVGGGAFELGAEGVYGYNVRGLGLRTSLLAVHGRSLWRPVGAPDRRSGPQVRLLWLAPQIGGQATLSWSWEL